MKNKQWALAWLSELDRIVKSHEDESNWITTNEACKMLLDIEQLLRIELEIK